jgi:hypothetical protein
MLPEEQTASSVKVMAVVERFAWLDSTKVPRLIHEREFGNQW